MQMKYIFIKKEGIKKVDSKIYFSELGNQIKPMLKRLFKNLLQDSFDIQIDGVDYKVNYINSGNNLILNANETDSKSVKILNEANAILLRGEHRKDYNIALSFDGVSFYYCNKIYPKFNLFERKIRELVFNILIKSFGNRWYDQTVSEQLDKEIKAKAKSSSKSKMIEQALYEMTIYQLETYLFVPYREIDASNLIDKELSEEVIKDKSRDEIINIINKGRSKSLWDRFFIGIIQIDNFHSKLEDIRNYRNNVAHCKHFYNDEYKECSQMLNGIIKQLDIAIENIESREFVKYDMTESLAVLSGIMRQVNEQLKISSESILKMTNELGKYELPKIKFNFPNFSQQIVNSFSKMNLSILEDEQKTDEDDF